MASTWYFNRADILDRVQGALEDAIDEAASRVAADAKQRAPIRKVFKEKPGFRFKERELTGQEKSIATRLANEYYGSRGMEFERRRAVAHIAYYARVRLPSRKSMNTIANSRSVRVLGVVRKGRFTSDTGARQNLRGGFEPGPEAKARLTGRGRYEVRTGRAVHRAKSAGGRSTRVQIGGALKASIHANEVVETADGVEATVSASIRYAKYVEFPTIHNRAQPFLLPALKDEQRTLAHSVAAAIRRSLGG